MFLADERKVEILKLSDDIFFIKCFSENPECVRLLIRVILERDNLEKKSTNVLNKTDHVKLLVREDIGTASNSGPFLDDIAGRCDD